MPFRPMLCALAASVLAFAATGPTVAADPPYEINVIESLTGGLAFVGNAQVGALKALEDYVNKTGGIRGRPLKFVITDDQTNPQTAVQLLNEIIAKHVPLVLGAGGAGSCNAMFPLVANSGPLMYCMSNAVNPVPGKFAFSADVSNMDQLVAGLHYFRQRGWTRFATMTATDASGQVYDKTLDAIMDRPENKGMTLVVREHVSPSDNTATAQLARIKASNPQVLLVGATGVAAGTIFRAINDVGLDIPVATGNGNATHAAMQQYAAFLPKELYFLSFLCLAPNEVTDRATKAALDTYFKALAAAGIDPDGLETGSWDPGLMVVSALRKLGTNVTAQQLSDYITNQIGFHGANGAYDFHKSPVRGLDESDVIIARYDAATKHWTGVSKPGGLPK